jgi:hypothetical protein
MILSISDMLSSGSLALWPSSGSPNKYCDEQCQMLREGALLTSNSSGTLGRAAPDLRAERGG